MPLFVQENPKLRWSWAESKEKLYQTEENISRPAARGVNHSWVRPHGVPISDSMTYSSSSRRYLHMDCCLKLPKFLTLFSASDRIWWLLQKAKRTLSCPCEPASSPSQSQKRMIYDQWPRWFSKLSTSDGLGFQFWISIYLSESPIKG